MNAGSRENFAGGTEALEKGDGDVPAIKPPALGSGGVPVGLLTHQAGKLPITYRSAGAPPLSKPAYDYSPGVCWKQSGGIQGSGKGKVRDSTLN